MGSAAVPCSSSVQLRRSASEARKATSCAGSKNGSSSSKSGAPSREWAWCACLGSGVVHTDTYTIDRLGG